MLKRILLAATLALTFATSVGIGTSRAGDDFCDEYPTAPGCPRF